MERAFISKLHPLLEAVAQEMTVYVPRKVDEHYVYQRYAAETDASADFNEVRVCTPAKEFLFPMREIAAVFPEAVEPEQVKPFAVWGLKACDLRSIEILDRVFMEKEFEDPFYVARREAMFVIAGDCTDPNESCFCNVLGGRPYAEAGYDLNISQVADGFVITAQSRRGKNFLATHADLFGDVPDDLLAERDERREEMQRRLQEVNATFELGAAVGEIVERGYESHVFDDQAATCVECQGCTRVCPTCHCFYLYDTAQGDYFAKLKMWDSCMRVGYAAVAGGGNPQRVLGDRLRHRLMHKFSHFLERYGVDMCVGCGRCIDAEAGDVDIRVVLKKLNDEPIARRKKAVAKKAK